MSNFNKNNSNLQKERIQIILDRNQNQQDLYKMYIINNKIA